jgi:Family of unknown function (DUF5677)
MAGHVRKGRRYLSPLAATGLLRMGDWVRDDLPDLLWPALSLVEPGTSGVIQFVRWQKAVQGDLAGRVERQALADGLDGRFTNLDRLVEQVPEARQVIKDRVAEFGLLPESVARVLASYPERPAAWLVDLDVAPPSQQEIDLLARAILETLGDGHRESVIKCLSIWSAVQAGVFSCDKTTIDLLKVYPNDPATRTRADSVVRASWGAQKGRQQIQDPARFDASVKWAHVFWGVNSMTTPCVRHRSPAETQTEGLDTSAENNSSGDDLRQFAMDLLASYVEAIETSPSRLYDQEQQEVHTGLVARVGREVIAVLGAPDLWCMEHGSHVVRTLVEVRIYLQWMALQHSKIYQEYQEYGAGKAKLYARIMEELPKDRTGSEFNDAIEELDRLSHNHDVLDHRVVDTRDSFAEGKSIRVMAEECGLLDFYRQAYSIASGTAHTEWWSVESNCMERCLNVLHRGHLIPSLTLSVAGNVDLAKSWVDQLHALIRISLEILDTDERSVTDAFSWLLDEADQGLTDHDGPAAASD